MEDKRSKMKANELRVGNYVDYFSENADQWLNNYPLSENGVVWIERENNIFNNPALIEYVHQLQNLYFALTGSELS